MDKINLLFQSKFITLNFLEIRILLNAITVLVHSQRNYEFNNVTVYYEGSRPIFDVNFLFNSVLL